MRYNPSNKSKLVLITGTSKPTINASNIYVEKLTNNYEIFVLEEKNITFPKAIKTLKKRWGKYGFWSVLNLLALRVFLLFFHKPEEVNKNYKPDLKVQDLTGIKTQEFLTSVAPDILIINGCSILKKELLNVILCPIINAHFGITPRFRGRGNFWAFYENSTELVGATAHFVDSGVDSGERISVKNIDFRERNVPFQEVDTVSLAEGALLVVNYLLKKEKNIPPPYTKLENRFYPLPGLSHYLRARSNYYRHLNLRSSKISHLKDKMQCD